MVVYFSNDKGEIMLSYARPVSDTNAKLGNGKDQIKAQVEELRKSVRDFKQLMLNYCQD